MVSLENALNTLERKHLLVIGKSEAERQLFIAEIIKSAGLETFRFPKKMESIDTYLEFVRTQNLSQPWYEKKKNVWWKSSSGFSSGLDFGEQRSGRFGGVRWNGYSLAR